MDQEIASITTHMHTKSTAVDVLICTSIEDIRAATSKDVEMQMLQPYIIKG